MCMTISAGMADTLKTWTPVAQTGLGVLTQLYGASIAAKGYERQGEAEQMQMEHNARVAEDNAENATYAAGEARKAGSREAKRHEQRVRLMVSRQKAAYGASGVDVNAGAPVDIMSDSILAGADDAAVIRRNAAMEAWGMKTRAADYRAQAGMYRVKGADSKAVGKIRAGSTLLTGMGSVSSTFNSFFKAKGWV